MHKFLKGAESGGLAGPGAKPQYRIRGDQDLQKLEKNVELLYKFCT